MTDALVQLAQIRKTYGALVALDDVNLDIQAGQFVVLLGPSGSGKTTLLSILGGFVEPTSGQVLIEGEDVTGIVPARRPTVTVFQDYALFPHMTARDNVGFGLAMRKVPKAERQQRAEAMLATVGLEGLGARRIGQLSGGQRQRVALARAIVVEPKVLLLDEPLGALDLKIRRQMQDELVQLQRRIETTFVHVTHDQEEAMNIADIVVVMSNGRIEDVGPPERVYLRPASLFTATFMGDTNIVTGRVAESDGKNTRLETSFGPLTVPGTVETGADAHLSIRPEQLSLGGTIESDSVALGEVRVTSNVFQGPNRLCHAHSAGDPTVEWIIRQPPQSTVAPGDVVKISARQSDIVLLRD
jgi:spermidine/putrescine transport system ATP-binding protein